MPGHKGVQVPSTEQLLGDGSIKPKVKTPKNPTMTQYPKGEI